MRLHQEFSTLKVWANDYEVETSQCTMTANDRVTDRGYGLSRTSIKAACVRARRIGATGGDVRIVNSKPSLFRQVPGVSSTASDKKKLVLQAASSFFNMTGFGPALCSGLCSFGGVCAIGAL